MSASPAGLVVVIGDVMADIAIKPTTPVRPGSDAPSAIRLGVGGAGANTAIHLARAGVPVLLLGRVGDDDLGRFVLGRLRHEGVVLPGSPCPGAATGAIGILIDETGQRTMFPQEGANARVDAAFIQRHWPPGGARGRAAALFVSGYALFRQGSRSGVRWAMAQAQAAGIPVFVDPASYAFIEDAGADQFLAWAAGATVLLPNREEAAALGGPQSLADRFPLVVVTLDEAGAWAFSATHEWRVAGASVPVVDTTGAGDAFNAGFIAAYTAGEDVEAALEAGNRLAGAIVQRLGPT